MLSFASRIDQPNRPLLRVNDASSILVYDRVLTGSAEVDLTA